MPSCDEPHPPSLRSYDTVAAAAAAAVAAGAPSHRAGVVSVGVGVGARDLGAIERAIERACVRGRSARTCGRVGLGELLSAVACALLSGMASRSNGFIYTRRDSAIGIICKSDSRSHQRSLLVDGIGFDLEISLASRTTAASGIR